MGEQAHERLHLKSRTLPVVYTESIEGEVLDPQFNSRFDRGPHRFGAGGMTLPAQLTATARPTAVAVHDDGYVARKLTCRGLGARRQGGVGQGKLGCQKTEPPSSALSWRFCAEQVRHAEPISPQTGSRIRNLTCGGPAAKSSACPPCASATARTMESPSPVPPCSRRVVTKRRNNDLLTCWSSTPALATSM